MDPNEFVDIVAKSIDKLQFAFMDLAAENPEDHIKVTRKGMDLTIDVAKVGPYKFTIDIHSQQLIC